MGTKINSKKFGRMSCLGEYFNHIEDGLNGLVEFPRKDERVWKDWCKRGVGVEMVEGGVNDILLTLTGDRSDNKRAIQVWICNF